MPRTPFISTLIASTPVIVRWVYRRFFWFFCGGVVLTGFLFSLWLRYGGTYLIVETEVSPSDVIIVLGGGTERAQEAVNLYNEGYAPVVLFTGGHLRVDLMDVHLDWGSIMRYAARMKGLPSEALLLELESTSTYEDAVNTRRMLEEKGWHSAIVVSSIYHMRRTKMTFDHVYAGSGIRLQYRPAPTTRLNPDGWWKREDDSIYVVNEYLKMALYWFKYL